MNDIGTEEIEKVPHGRIAELVDSSLVWGHTSLIDGFDVRVVRPERTGNKRPVRG